MMHQLSVLLLALAMFAGSLVPATAEKRVALVIGINQYDNLPVLQKAVNDKKAVAAALAELGFDVIAGENLTRREMNAKLAELDARIAPGDTVFFFFAGHGLALGAENYLLPRDLPKPNDGEENLVRDEGHSVDAIVRRVQGQGAAVSFFVLDACRDNPLAATGVRSIGSSRGLTRVDTPKGVFVLFSAGLGQTALDRLADDDPDPNSVFTRRLVPLLETPGMTHVALAKRVQREVDELAATVRHSQQPAYYDQIIGEIRLSPGAAPSATSETKARPPAADPALAAWNATKDTENVSVLEAFIARFGDSFYAALAKAKLTELKRKKEQTELAAVDSKDAGAKEESSGSESALPQGMTREQLAHDIVTELKEFDCYQGRVSGKWGSTSRAALKRFNKIAKLELPVDAPQAETLQAVKDWKGAHCQIAKAVPPSKPKRAARPSKPKRAAPPKKPAKARKAPPSRKRVARPRRSRQKSSDSSVGDAQRELQRAFPATNWPGGH